MLKKNGIFFIFSAAEIPSFTFIEITWFWKIKNVNFELEQKA